jgi:hypothetical protein
LRFVDARRFTTIEIPARDGANPDVNAFTQALVIERETEAANVETKQSSYQDATV